MCYRDGGRHPRSHAAVTGAAGSETSPGSELAAVPGKGPTDHIRPVII